MPLADKLEEVAASGLLLSLRACPCPGGWQASLNRKDLSGWKVAISASLPDAIAQVLGDTPGTKEDGGVFG